VTYEYQCDTCGKQFEIKATVAEKKRGLRLECPACGSTQATQVYSSMSVITRSPGGGFCGPGSGPGCC